MNLEKLNPAQKEAVLSTEGAIMVLAGAGSGKTRTLVTRISYLLQEKAISPFKLLALTFSNKAAKEMRDRVASEIKEDVGALQITTFHAFCAKVLRSESHYIGLSRNFTIYDTSETKAVVKAILSRRGISTKEISPYEIMYFIDDIKNHGHYDGRTSEYYEVDRDDQFYEFYQEYESELHRANAVDFGGLIVGVLQLFEQFPDVLERYQKRFQYILVDEYQDTNRAQFDLLFHLSRYYQNICVVGDEDQSIYSWRGADINNILDFEKTFPEAGFIKLEQNYRSSRNIIEAASYVISQNKMRKGKNMWTENPHGDAVQIHECHNDKKEAEFICDEILSLSQNHQAELRDIAVFYRANSQSRIIEDYLRRAKIPYRVVGGVKFYERKEIKDLVAYLRLVVNPKDSLAFSRVVNVPARGIGATTLRKLEGEAISRKLSLGECVEEIVSDFDSFSHLKLSAKVKSSLRSFMSLIQDARHLETEKILPHVIYEKMLHESGYFDFLKSSKDYESIARLENLQELSSALKQFEMIEKEPSLMTFLETITLDQQADETSGQGQTGEVALMTVHGAKGLEFPYVFLSGAEENIFPSYRSLEEGANAEEEERRLFYVAMTRAMKRLYITFAQGRMLFGQLKFNGPSRFLDEVPKELCQWHKFGRESDFSYREHDGQEDDFSQETFYDEDEVVYQVKSQPQEKKSRFPKGSKIKHDLYGMGKVVDSQGLGPEEKVVIKFSDGARKKFMVKFAPLTLVN